MLVPLLSMPAASQDGGKVLRVHQTTDPDIVDPQKSSFANEIELLVMNYEGLTRQDNNLQTVGAAAESWEFDETGTVLTFHLREGLTYSDGSPLTAERFRYAVERTCDPNTAGQYQSILFEIVGCAEFAGSLTAPEVGEGTPAAEVDPAAYETTKAALGVKAIDDLTLEITLTNPAPYFPTVASLWVFHPAKQELIEQGGEDWWMDPALQIGNGPFQMTEYVEEQQVTLVANENYWAGRPLLDGIEIVYQGESAVALEAYRAGDLDIMDVDPQQIPEIQADSELAAQVVQYPVASTYNLSFNLTQEPFTDIKVREAFSLAFDRETYCAVVRNGDCSPTLSWIPTGLPGSIETDKFGFNPEAAVQALAESSYGGPEGLPPISLFYNSDDTANTARAEWVAGQYRDILGIEITLEPTEGTALVELRKEPTPPPRQQRRMHVENLVGGEQRLTDQHAVRAHAQGLRLRRRDPLEHLVVVQPLRLGHVQPQRSGPLGHRRRRQPPPPSPRPVRPRHDQRRPVRALGQPRQHRRGEVRRAEVDRAQLRRRAAARRPRARAAPASPACAPRATCGRG
jgi:oligopeptide transport system substrate-binding protein